MTTDIHRSINIAQELRSGRHYGVFLDDTGSPGLVTPGLHTERKSWVAVLIPPHLVAEAMDQMPKALSLLEEFGLKDPEFHFTDIMAGKGEFRKLSLQERLGIFRFMVDIFKTCGFKVLVQTLDPVSARELLSRARWPESLGPLQLGDHRDLALILALLRVRLYLKSIDGSAASACVIVDEGRLPSGTAIVIPGWAPTFVEGAILFANSRLVHSVQLADFAAFVMNRSQLLRVRCQLSGLDKTFLEIVSPIVENFINIDKVTLDGWPNISSVREGLNHSRPVE